MQERPCCVAVAASSWICCGKLEGIGDCGIVVQPADERHPDIVSVQIEIQQDDARSPFLRNKVPRMVTDAKETDLVRGLFGWFCRFPF